MFAWLKRIFGTKRRPPAAPPVTRDESASGSRSPTVPATPSHERPSPAAHTSEAQGQFAYADPAQLGLFRRAEAPAEEVTIGVDFGTHSTKIVTRRATQPYSEVLTVAEPPSSDNDGDDRFGGPYPWFGVPSVVAVRGGAMYFGDVARRSTGWSQRFVGLKACLLPDPSGDRLSATKLALVGGGPSHEVAEVLAAAYLAWLFAEIRQRLDTEYDAGNYRPYMQVAAPMDHYDNAELRLRYERIVSAAWSAAFELDSVAPSQGERVVDVMARLRELLSGSLESHPLGTRRFEVLPETVASLVPLSEDPAFDEAVYTIIDIGGGTTEFSVNHISYERNRRKLLCYQDRTKPMGVRRLNLARSSSGAAFQAIVDEIAREQRTTWGRGHEYVTCNRVARGIWHRNVVLKAGGGWTLDGVEARIARNDPSAQFYRHDSDHSYRIVTYTPSEQVLRSGRGLTGARASDRSMFHLLPVALGLSIRGIQWPRYFPPSDATPPPADDRECPPPDATHGHW